MFDAEKIARETVLNILGYWQRLERQLYWNFSGNDPISPIHSSPLGEEIKLLCQVANGEIEADQDAIRGEVAETIQGVCETLFAPPGANNYDIPDYFWKSELGQVIQRCQLWSRRDSLITHKEAAVILYGADGNTELKRVSRLIDAGKLTGYIDPKEPNPQRAGRVSRIEVESHKSDE